MTDRVIVDYKSPEGPTTLFVRSTLIGASLQTLRSLGYYERFVTLLEPRHHEAVLYNFAPVWLPVEVAVAYYDAWERLGLSDAELESMGSAVCQRVMGSLLGTLLRGARAAGATPWIPLGQFDRLWSRILRGGAVKITEKGPKEALVETSGLPMLRGRYFRLAYRTLLITAGSLFCKVLYLKERQAPAPDAHCALVSWV